ncbi:hypothetical protein ACA910_001717 [Epithemia clementina (nom. ined.)]
MDAIRDGVVSSGTLSAYISDITEFLIWIRVEHSDWFTDHGKLQFDLTQHRLPSESPRAFKIRSRASLEDLYRDAHSHPVLHLNLVSAESFMQFISLLRSRRNGMYLSKSAYGNKRAALNHFCRLHNRLGYPEHFKLELANLYRGFFRNLVQRGMQGGRRGGGQRQPNNGPIAQPEPNNNGVAPNVAPRRPGSGSMDGKEPMSVELYRGLCKWFFDWGTMDGVFAHAFLVLSWNLMCRAKNTASIKMSDVRWINFDCFEIFFGHSKTDQLGDNAKYPRHLFANPNDPLVCPVVALSLYFSCCFNTNQTSESSLFPGNLQHDHFKELLTRILAEHRDEVIILGYQDGDLGTHSIRKGATTFISSLPGGPPPTAVCIRGGWTMGHVKDVYMRYATAGDEFVGRCLCLLPLLQTTFGISPLHFGSWVGEALIQRTVSSQFPMVHQIEGFGKMCRMCLASTLYHRKYISNFASYHIARITSYVFRHASTLECFTENLDAVVTKIPWEDRDHHFSGIPPHLTALHELMEVKTEQRALVDKFIDRMKVVLDERGIEGGNLTVAQLQAVIANGVREIRQRLDKLEGGPLQRRQQNQEDPQQALATQNSNYTLHFHHGQFSRVPSDWRFPRIGVLDCWRHWWIGDNVRKAPPLRMLTKQDVEWLARVPLSEEEKHGRTGRDSDKRRLPRKTLSDMKFLMNHLTKIIKDKGKFIEPAVATTADVNAMFYEIADEFQGIRDAQKKWVTVVNELRDQAADDRRELAGRPRQNKRRRRQV